MRLSCVHGGHGRISYQKDRAELLSRSVCEEMTVCQKFRETFGSFTAPNVEHIKF